MRSTPAAILFTLVLASFGACSEGPDRSPTTPSVDHSFPGGAQNVGVQPVGDLLVPLIPATPDVFVTSVTPGADPAEIAGRNGWVVERVLSGNVVVFSAVTNPGDLDSDTDIASYELNQPAGLALGQELTMGFYEGQIFDVGDLQAGTSLSIFGYSSDRSPDLGVGVRVGVIDTGADIGHSLLVDRIVLPVGADWLGWEETPDGIDNDNDGLIDEAFGHGTFVAGMIAQLAPGAQIIPIRALNSDGFGSLADVLSAMDALLAQGIDVLNLSLSLSSYSPTFEARLQTLSNAGVRVIAAAGNQGGATAYPANSSLAVGVAALESPSVLASFSNRDRFCELAAPGVGLLSCYPGEALGWGDGTSFAAPVVAGCLAATLSLGADLDCLLSSAVALDPLLYGQLALPACSGLSRAGSRVQVEMR